MDRRLRAAVIGASGIGRYHAKWLVHEGADLVAIVGSSSSSTQVTAARLSTTLGFTGRAYAAVDDMLARERPDVVSIASPPHLHADHALRCLEAGAHVLCEKPFVWAPGVSFADLEARARAVLAAADRADRVFCLMTQYVSLVPSLQEIARLCSGPDTGVWQFGMRFESMLRDGAVVNGDDVWVDLGPHPLAVAAALLPGWHLAPGSLTVAAAGLETRVTFDMSPPPARPNQPLCAVELLVSKGEDPQRWFEVNGMRIHYEGRNDESGEFHVCLRVGDTSAGHEDPMRLTVRSFLAKCSGLPHGPLLGGSEGLETLRVLFTVLRERQPR